MDDRNSPTVREQSDGGGATTEHVVGVAIRRQRVHGQTLSQPRYRFVRIICRRDTELEAIAIERRHRPPTKETHQRKGWPHRLLTVSDHTLVVTVARTPSHVAGDLLHLCGAFASTGIQNDQRHLALDSGAIRAELPWNLRVHARRVAKERGQRGGGR